MSFIQDDRVRDSLTPDDMVRMNIGRRWWECTIDLIPDEASYKGVLARFVANIGEHVREGRGLLFHGPYSSGKTGAGVIVAKAVVMYGGTAFFMAAPELSDLKIEKAMFDSDVTVWSRMLSVDLLVLDDLGSEHISEWGKSLIERMTRLRSNNMLSIVCTTNQFGRLSEIYGDSMISVLKAVALPVKVDGVDWRDEEAEALRRAIVGGE